MHYQIRLGIPEFEAWYMDLVERAENAALAKDEIRLFKRVTKILCLLAENPRHNSLQTHEIDSLSRLYTKKYGVTIKVWQSYLENNTPAAGRLFWVYGPNAAEISVIGIEPHPEDQKKTGYSRVRLSGLPR